MQIQSLSGEWQFSQAGRRDWLPAVVPGSVHLDLLAAGRIPDPFAADNERRVQWVAEADWEYRRVFTARPELLAEDGLWLVCEGLDTLATVIFNGHELGQTDNMFRRYEWDVRPFILGPEAAGKPVDNQLVIRFASPVRFAAEKQAVRSLPGVSQAIAGGPHLRKAPCQFGWDWGPQLPPTGIWKDIRLEGRTGARMRDVHLRQAHAHGQVTVEVCVAVERLGPADGPLTASARITAPDGVVVEGQAALGPGDRATIQLPITQPQLWWPNGYGEQPLYQVGIEGRGQADRLGEACAVDRGLAVEALLVEDYRNPKP